MAQTRKRRRRKHRGTQAGTIETPGRTGRTSRARSSSTTAKPRTRSEAREVARQKRQNRFDQPPTWRGSLNRALLAAVILAVLISVVSHKPAQGLVLGVFAIAIYTPMTYFTDGWLYRRRQRQKQKSAR